MARQCAESGSKDSVENLERLRAGDIDFGLVQGGLAFDDSHLRSVACVDIEYLHVIVTRSSSLREFRDLAGKRVATGTRGYGSYALVESILQAASMQPPVELVLRSTLAEAFSGGFFWRNRSPVLVFETELP